MYPKPRKHENAPKLLGTYYRFMLKPPLDVLVPDPDAAPAANGNTREPYVLMHTPKLEAQVPAARVSVAERATAEDVVDTPVDAPSTPPITAFDATPERPESPGEVTGLIEHLSLAGGGTYSTDGDAALKRSNDLTVGTWNLLHPVYALEKGEPEGITQADLPEDEVRRWEIHADDIGLVLGAGGVVIKQLKRDAKAKAVVLKLTTAAASQGSGWVQLNGGSLQDCIALKASIDKLYARNVYNRSPGSLEVVPGGAQSNWSERAPQIGKILEKGRLDVYLLQEVGEKQLQDIAPYISELYESVLAVPLNRTPKLDP